MTTTVQVFAPHRLTYHRDQAGYTLIQLAQALGVHRTTVDRWEHGECAPRSHQLVLLVAELNLNVSDLLEPADPAGPPAPVKQPRPKRTPRPRSTNSTPTAMPFDATQLPRRR